MGQLLNEPVIAEHDPSGRLTAYRWRGDRYTVDGILKSYGARVYRVRVSGADGRAIVELGRDAGDWRLRHVFPA
ncbi:hypothetical protein BTM25_06790 [Actinomadura rubteroloni]|uniref:Uncharacterized protein n=1 Tax=Actinomadura rubteroloni TaxID=1926885 RepID=A0A2P4UML1_9ACTN|nr:hypothetical protein [Actinomadura rubteroloni]POM26284.1 hypothetical protein BTM25_06790 [Actinomadura rubteroloni]